MNWLSNKRLGIKLLSICNELEFGKYEITKHTENNTYHVVLYDVNDVGVYAGIFNINHKHLIDALIRLAESVNRINKIHSK